MSQPTDSAKKSYSNNLNCQMAQYSLVAAVAGVSILTLAQPAAGEVVVTRKTIQVPLSPFGGRDPATVSMANNGVTNFFFYLSGTSSFRLLFMYRSNSLGGVVLHSTSPAVFASALPRGAKVGPSEDFECCSEVTLEDSYINAGKRGFGGQWGGNLKNRYLGVRFILNGQAHFGWIRMTVTTSPNLNGPRMTATITGYAYETVPNKPILAGTATGTSAGIEEQPTAEVQVPRDNRNQAGASLGMLALGADGVPLWRREETSPSR